MSFYSDPMRYTARKLHRCSWCGELIDAGQSYWRWFGVNDDGEPSTVKMHPECNDARQDDDDDEFYFYQSERPTVAMQLSGNSG